MRSCCWLFAVLLGLPGWGWSQTRVVPDEETLHYSVNWPSGLSLGEGEMSARLVRPGQGAAERWEFTFSLDAAVPAFAVEEDHRSVANSAFCSLELEKNSTRGKRKAREKSTFDVERGTVTRVTGGGGGKSEIQAAACAKDALTYLYYLRRELGQGRLPPAQTVLFGAPYQIRLQYGGLQSIRVGDTRVEADRLVASVKGPASEATFEMFFSRDEARTPVLFKVPLSMGTFAMELVR